MPIYGVSVSATDLPRAQAFYELLGFRFPEADPGHSHLEAEDDSGSRLLVDSASSLAELYGAPPRPGSTAGFAMIVTSPESVDETVGRVRSAGHVVTTDPYDAPWGHRYARVADPDGYEVVVFCPLSPDVPGS
jgi:catechol 2,3-dioxygenase-like lactoylglutathione lyase family enzyme